MFDLNQHFVKLIRLWIEFTMITKDFLFRGKYIEQFYPEVYAGHGQSMKIKMGI